MKKITCFLFLFIGLNPHIFAQENFVDLIITLQNKNGGYFKNQTINITSKSNGRTFKLSSDNQGKAHFVLPTKDIYNITISNYSKKNEIRVPNLKGGTMTNVFTYSSNMLEMDKKFAMSESEKLAINKFKTTLPDTLFLKSSKMAVPSKNKTFYSSTTIHIKNIYGEPLANEIATITSEESKKSIKTKTDKSGNIHIYVPKGDTYTINFIYNKKYAKFETEYSKGTSNIKLKYSYLGTVEIERRKKEEDLRIIEEEKRLKAEEERSKIERERLKLTAEAYEKRKLEGYIDELEFNNDNNIISKILDRNKWKNKLIVCDLTGSMSPYTAELSVWYALNMANEKNLQFVFFNDGDNTNDSDKEIGSTGGVYYSNSMDVAKLNTLITKVSAAGSGGDCEENDMEALIKGTKEASPFNELVLIADSDSPVRDIELLKDFNSPIHIILCGFNGFILEDYLKMAWKSKGSIHTIEEDITRIANMMEGDTIKIHSKTYKIMGGDFVHLN